MSYWPINKNVYWVLIGKHPVYWSHRATKNRIISGHPPKKIWKLIEKTSMMASALGYSKDASSASSNRCFIEKLALSVSKSYKYFHLIKVAYP